MKLSVVTPLWQDRPAEENLEVARNADKFGYPELWIGEMATYDVFAFATAVGHRTDNIAMTLGPLCASMRTPMTMAMGLASVSSLVDRPCRLALGASSVVVVERWHGRPRQRTATLLDESAQILNRFLAGEKVVFEGQTVQTSGYHLRLPPPGPGVTIAAFGPAAIRAAARRADRMLLNMVTPHSLAALRSQLVHESSKLGKEPPTLAVWLTCAVDPAPEALEQICRALVGYLAAPGYDQMFIEAGYESLVELARTRPHPKELLAAMPNDLPANIGLVGTEAEIRDRLEVYRQAGADEVCLVPATAGDNGGARTLAAMCPG